MSAKTRQRKWIDPLSGVFTPHCWEDEGEVDQITALQSLTQPYTQPSIPSRDWYPLKITSVL